MNGDNPGQLHGMGPKEPFQGLQEKLDLEHGLRQRHESSHCPLRTIKTPFPNKQQLQGRKNPTEQFLPHCSVISASRRIRVTSNSGITSAPGDQTLSNYYSNCSSPANLTPIKSQLPWHLDSWRGGKKPGRCRKQAIRAEFILINSCDCNNLSSD